MSEYISSSLKDLIDKIIDYRGKTPKKLNGNWIESGIPALSAKNIKNGKIVNHDSIRYIDNELYNKWMKEEVKKGDILMTSEAPLGETYFLKDDSKICLSQRLFAIRVNDEIMESKFLYYYFNTDQGRNELLSRATGTTVGGIRQTALMKVVVHYPKSMELQQLIAGILSSYDYLIENNERRIKLLEEIAQQLYTEWFVKFRFPGYDKVRMIDSGTEYGAIPEKWEVSSVSKVAEINARTFKNKEKNQDINYVDIAAVTTGKINETQLMSFSGAPSRARRVVQHGDIIWSTVRPNRKSYALVIDPMNNLVVSTGFAVVTATKLPYTYLYHALTTDDFVKYLIKNARGAAYPAVTSTDFERAFILCPSKQLLNQFHVITSSLYMQKEILSKKNACLMSARDLLIPQLVMGQRELK